MRYEDALKEAEEDGLKPKNALCRTEPKTSTESQPVKQ